MIIFVDTFAYFHKRLYQVAFKCIIDQKLLIYIKRKKLQLLFLISLN